MKKSEIIKTIKEELKLLAKEIHLSKETFKNEQRKGGNIWTFLHALYKLQNEYRHRHIARCLLRGRKYNQIEKPAENNKPDWDKIKEFQKSYEERLAKADTELNQASLNIIKNLANEKELEENLLQTRTGN